MQKKGCSICGKKLNLDDFYRDSRGAYGLRSECKSCTRLRAKACYVRKKMRPEDNWNEMMKRLNLTAEENFDMMHRGATIIRRGKMLMQDGVVIDQEWYKRILAKSIYLP